MSSPSQAAEASFTASAQQTVRLIESGYLADLRWPDFSDVQPDLRRFYGLLGYQTAWLRGTTPTPQALALIDLFQRAAEKGLNPEDYDGPRWAERLTRLAGFTPQSPGAGLSDFDVALSISAIRYTSSLESGRVSPRRLQFEITPQRDPKIVEFLRAQVVPSNDVPGALESVEPRFPGYVRTKEALRKYLALSAAGDGEEVPVPSKVVKPGNDYEGIAQLAHRLARLGDLPEPSRTEAAVKYEGAIVDAVKHFQGRHGLPSDGRLTLATVRELNVPLSYRVLQLQLTLERWRWIPHEFPEPPILVNIPEFELRAYDSTYHPTLAMKVIVGKAYRHKTPVFAEAMQYVVFRPYWNVPESIQRAELVPHLIKDRGYLAKHDYEVVTRSEQIVATGAVSDDVMRQLRSGALQIRQRPGTKNSLGLVKFIFPNAHDVYLHGTPEMQLFSQSRRDFSHGCIRVENPVALAEWVLRKNPNWTEDRIRAAMNGDETFQLNLTTPIPVLIMYGTAVVLENGDTHFLDDIYGLDASLQSELEKGYPYPQ